MGRERKQSGRDSNVKITGQLVLVFGFQDELWNPLDQLAWAQSLDLNISPYYPYYFTSWQVPEQLMLSEATGAGRPGPPTDTLSDTFGISHGNTRFDTHHLICTVLILLLEFKI
ncbi:hypothetical protein B0H14DRAFT_2585729 [Mycena olivaceomarginata]|nr:hypothetical protein B0H14DRAFT_2585729 [Mycena olivaceomarginata]